MAAELTEPDAAAVAARLETLTSWNADWRGLRVAVLGLGVTGFAVADTLTELGADVLVLAPAVDDDRARILEVIGARLLRHPLDAVPDELVAFAPELIVASPGFHPDHPVLEWAGDAGVAVWGDIELAWRVRDKVNAAEWILVTGTNGKTTTVQLAATFLAANGLRAAPCGNIGVPVLDAVRDPGGFDVLVVELSSYQLHHLPTTGPGALHPWASVVLNVADDHLDWHGSPEAYRAAKATVYANTKVACVYNRADEATHAHGRGRRGRGGRPRDRLRARRAGPERLRRRRGHPLRPRLPRRAPHRRARDHHASTSSSRAASPRRTSCRTSSRRRRSRGPYGVPVGVIHDALGDFRLDAHRIETVAVAGGIRWIDDSKATNPHAAEASLRGVRAGGVDRRRAAQGRRRRRARRGPRRTPARRGRDRRRPRRARRGVPATRARTAPVRGGRPTTLRR